MSGLSSPHQNSPWINLYCALPMLPPKTQTGLNVTLGKTSGEEFLYAGGTCPYATNWVQFMWNVMTKELQIQKRNRCIDGFIPVRS